MTINDHEMMFTSAVHMPSAEQINILVRKETCSESTFTTAYTEKKENKYASQIHSVKTPTESVTLSHSFSRLSEKKIGKKYEIGNFLFSPIFSYFFLFLF